MDWKTFIKIYRHPVWNDSLPGGLAYGYTPKHFEAKSLYQGALVELEHTGDPFIAIEIAMDHLAEDPDYYLKLAKMETRRATPARNPDPYVGWSLHRLKKEEQRLAETLDDYQYFKEDPKKIAIVKDQLAAVRQAMRPTQIAEVLEHSPESAIRDHLVFLHSEAKTLKSLEQLAFDEGNFSAGAAYRRKREGITDTIDAINTLLTTIQNLRKVIAEQRQTYNQTLSRAAEIEAALEKKPDFNDPRAVESYRNQQFQRDGLLADLYRSEKTISGLNHEIDSKLRIAHHDLERIGYGMQPVTPLPSPPRIELQVIETPAPLPAPAPLSRGEAALPKELRDAYEKLSLDPQIRALQQKLKAAVGDLIAAIENDDPPYLRKKDEERVAKLHAEIEKLLGRRRR